MECVEVMQTARREALQIAAGTFFLTWFHNTFGAFRTVGGAAAAGFLAFALATTAGCTCAFAVGGLGAFGAGAVVAEFAMVGAVTVGGA